MDLTKSPAEGLRIRSRKSCSPGNTSVFSIDDHHRISYDRRVSNLSLRFSSLVGTKLRRMMSPVEKKSKEAMNIGSLKKPI